MGAIISESMGGLPRIQQSVLLRECLDGDLGSIKRILHGLTQPHATLAVRLLRRDHELNLQREIVAADVMRL
jgi:hypothetical protein